MSTLNFERRVKREVEDQIRKAHPGIKGSRFLEVREVELAKRLNPRQIKIALADKPEDLMSCPSCGDKYAYCPKDGTRLKRAVE